jgi:hypothetical protein
MANKQEVLFAGQNYGKILAQAQTGENLTSVIPGICFVLNQSLRRKNGKQNANEALQAVFGWKKKLVCMVWWVSCIRVL